MLLSSFAHPPRAGVPGLQAGQVLRAGAGALHSRQGPLLLRPSAPLSVPPALPARLQHTTWQLGAPLVSMLYGLRLVASILLSKAILSYTVIDTGLQVGSGRWRSAAVCRTEQAGAGALHRCCWLRPGE